MQKQSEEHWHGAPRAPSSTDASGLVNKSMDEYRITEAPSLQGTCTHLIWPDTASLAGEAGCHKHLPTRKPPPQTALILVIWTLYSIELIYVM